MKTVWLITALIAICLILASPFASAKIYLLEHEDYEQYNLGSSPTLIDGYSRIPLITFQCIMPVANA